jgi:hypothetical protein
VRWGACERASGRSVSIPCEAHEAKQREAFDRRCQVERRESVQRFRRGIGPFGEQALDDVGLDPRRSTHLRLTASEAKRKAMA